MKSTLPPDHVCVDMLTEEEYDACRTPAEALRKGRRKARALAASQGTTGRLRELALRSLGDSVLFSDYTSSTQLGPMVASVSLSEGVRFRCSLERSLIDGAVIGVRVTLAAFTK